MIYPTNHSKVTPILSPYLERTLNHLNVSDAKPRWIRVQGEVGGCRKMGGWFWTNVGLDLRKHRNVYRGGSLTKIPHAKVLRGSIFLLGGKLVLVQGWFGQKVGAVWVKNESLLGECKDGFGSRLQGEKVGVLGQS